VLKKGVDFMNYVLKNNVLINIFLCALIFFFVCSTANANPLLEANEIGFDGQIRDKNYDTLVDAYFSNTNVVSTINNNLMVSENWGPTNSDNEFTIDCESTCCDKCSEACFCTSQCEHECLNCDLNKESKEV
jgi:hypothetical protein